MIQDLYNYSSLETGEFSQEKVYDLMKAMSATHQTGRDLDGTDTSGAALKTESLDPMLKILTNRDSHIVFWKMLAKQKAYNTVEEYNQLTDYGLDVGIFNTEGETPQFTDSIYTRRSVLIKYSGVSGEVTHPFQLVNLGSGVSNALAAEVQSKTSFLLRAINKSLPTANSSLVSNEFDGIFKQHFDGIVNGGTLDDYDNSSATIDARGKALTDANVEDAANAVVNDGFGNVSTIMGNPLVFNDYVKRFHESKRVMVNNPVGGTTGAIMGQAVNTIATQFGNIQIANDIFFDQDRIKGKTYNASATSTKAPAVPVTGGAPATPVDANAKFADGAGDYFYTVTAKNRYGESAMVLMDTTATTVPVGDAVDLTWTHTDGNYAVESFVVYRTEVDDADYTTAKFYPIFTVSKAEWTAGYDGGAAGVVRDRNRKIANTSSAIVLDFGIETLAFKQLAPMMRMDLARTSPSFRFMVLCYGTPVIFAPRKVAKIENLGRDIST